MRVKAKLSNTNIRKGKRKKDMRCLGQYTRALTLLQKLQERVAERFTSLFTAQMCTLPRP